VAGQLDQIGMVLRMSLPSSKVVEALTVPVRNPLPSGLNGTKPMPHAVQPVTGDIKGLVGWA
jgi:hypothetical protein